MYKLFHKKSFYICTILPILIFLGLTVSFSLIMGDGVVEFLPTILTTAIPSSLMIMVMGVFTALYVTEDFSDHAMKNIVARGYSRSMIFITKYLVSTIAVVIMAVLLLVAGAISGIVLGSSGSFSSLTAATLFTQVVIIVAVNTLYFSASMVLRKSGASLAFIVLAPSVVSLLLRLIPAFIKKLPFDPAEYWLDGLLEQTENIKNFAAVTRLLTVSACYIVVLTIAGYFLFRKKDY